MTIVRYVDWGAHISETVGNDLQSSRADNAQINGRGGPSMVRLVWSTSSFEVPVKKLDASASLAWWRT